MKTILGRIATFISGVAAGFIGFGMFICWCDGEDDSFILNCLPNARKRYIKDIKAARAEEQAKLIKALGFKKLEDD